MSEKDASKKQRQNYPYSSGGPYYAPRPVFYSNPMYPQGQAQPMPQMPQMQPMQPPQGQMQQPPLTVPMPEQPGATPQLPLEQSYIENILRLNRGKLATIYATFENNTKWNAEIFRGIIEAAGRDHVILSDPKTGKRYLIPMVSVDYITFDGEISYFPQTMAQYSPR